MVEISGGVTVAKGYEAAGYVANIKYQDRKDMALIYSTEPAAVAGVFTTNVVKAACVMWDKEIVAHSSAARAVVVNSGVANACTGAQGYEYCKETASAASNALNIKADEVLIASTGVIGMQLPIEKIVRGIEGLAKIKNSSNVNAHDAAKAIMTTDTFSKEVAVEFMIQGKTVRMGAMCKGSGMIHPNMCTMLGFVTTDLAISKELLQEALLETVEDTYNMVSVDGDTSTNDTVLLMANGLALNETIVEKDSDYYIFKEALLYVNTKLAKMLAKDGEGATILFETKVEGADTLENAKKLAKSVVCSSLTKAAMFGHDANWGRVLCAMGYSGADFNPDKVDLFFESKAGKIQIFKEGVATDYSEEVATNILSQNEVTVHIHMNIGNQSATAWGCDLSYDYVKINADYRS